MKNNRKTIGMQLKKSFIVNLSGRKNRRHAAGTGTTTTTEDTSTTTSLITVTHLV